MGSEVAERLEGVTVADLMDTEPVTIPGDLPLLRVQDEFFHRYRWSWFRVVDATASSSASSARSAWNGAGALGRPVRARSAS